MGGRVHYQGQPELRQLVTRALQVQSGEEHTRRHVHGFHSYPARLHPDTARALIEALSASGDRVLDPFCGSGTVLVEARELNRAGVGVDANPLSVELARCKASPGSSAERGRWLRAAYAVSKAADADRREKRAPGPPPSPADLELFSEPVLLELGALRQHIAELKDDAIRGVLLLVLSSILSKVSDRMGDSSLRTQRRALSSGYTIRFFRDRAGELGRQMAEFARRLPGGAPDVDVQLADSRRLEVIRDASIDLVVTSPPYPGVYDYLHHHETRMRWLGLDERAFELAEIGAKRRFSKLDKGSVGAQWTRELGPVLSEISRALRPNATACLVLADSAVAGEVLRADEVLRELAPAVSLHVLAVASQDRPHFHRPADDAFRDRPRREHLVILGHVPVNSPRKLKN